MGWIRGGPSSILGGFGGGILVNNSKKEEGLNTNKCQKRKGGTHRGGEHRVNRPIKSGNG